MLILEYSEKALSTAEYPNKGNNKLYPLLGLLGETGESAEKFKKQLRDNVVVSNEDIKKELGDIAWYLNSVMYECHVDYNLLFPKCVEKDFNFIGTFGRITLVKNEELILLIGIHVGKAIEAISYGHSKYDLQDHLKNIWHIWASLASNINSTPNEIVELNIKKLFDRKARGVIKGSGDNR